MKKRIGIVGWMIGDNSFGVTKPYAEYISRFGIPVILTPQHTEVEPVDLLILPGGKDVLPTTYGQLPSYHTGDPNIMLEHFDNVMLPKYLAAGTPILAICRGAQKLWSLFGGRIIQHYPWHKQSDYNTHQCHDLAYTEDFKAFGKLLKKVNSRHHQTMSALNTNDEFSVPEEIQVIAYAQDDKTSNPEVVELWKHRDRPIFGIQGHPEDMYEDNLIPAIIEQFLNRPVNANNE